MGDRLLRVGGCRLARPEHPAGGQWDSWYRHAVPAADDLYDEHLAELREEGLI
jgi:hypothetical protein